MSRCGYQAAVVVFLLAGVSACGDADPTTTTAPPTVSPLPEQSTSTTAASTTGPPTTTPPATTQPATTVAAPSLPLVEPADEGSPSGLIQFGWDGIIVAPFDGAEVAIPGDRFYPTVWQAEPDGVGGIVPAPSVTSGRMLPRLELPDTLRLPRKIVQG